MNKINFGWYLPLFFIHLRVKLAQIHFGISRFEIIPGSPLLCHQLSTHHLFSIKQTYLLLGWYKIVVLRVIADANDFKEPPQSFHQADDGHGNAMIEKIPSSHYTLNTIKKSSKEHFKSNSWTFSSITQRVQLSLEIYPTEMFVSIVIFLPSPDPKHENFRWDHGFQPSPSEAWNRDNLRINKMAAEIIHPTAPPHVYPPLLKGEDFRLNICDYQKELESDISHYKQVAKKYRRVKFIAHATSVSSGVTSTLFSLRGSLSGTGMVISVPLATSNIFFAFRSTGVSVYGQRLERKISKHEKTISIPEVKLLSISKPSQKLWMTIKSQI